MKALLFSLVAICVGLTVHATPYIPQTPATMTPPAASPSNGSTTAPTAPVRTNLVLEKIQCVDITESRLLDEPHSELTTEISEIRSERETWNVDTVTWVKTKGARIQKNLDGQILQTTQFSSLRSTTSHVQGHLLVERSNVETSNIDNTGAIRVKRQILENHFVLRGAERTLIRAFVDGTVVPDRTFTQTEHLYSDGRRVTSTVEKTPYVTKLSELNNDVLEVLRSESSCIIEPVVQF